MCWLSLLQLQPAWHALIEVGDERKIRKNKKGNLAFSCSLPLCFLHLPFSQAFLNLMLVLFFASRDFPAVTLIFALPHKENFFFSNSNSIWYDGPGGSQSSIGFWQSSYGLHSPVMVLHSLVLVFTQSSFNFYTVQFYFLCGYQTSLALLQHLLSNGSHFVFPCDDGFNHQAGCSRGTETFKF